MNWIFVVVRNNLVERTKVFSDFWEGAEYADNFIKRIDLNFDGNFPSYNRNEYYRRNDLTIGLYKDS